MRASRVSTPTTAPPGHTIALVAHIVVAIALTLALLPVSKGFFIAALWLVKRRDA